MRHLLKIKCAHSRFNVNFFASTSAPFRPTTVQVPNVALTATKRITGYVVDLLWKITYFKDEKKPWRLPGKD
jgi:hypothetical protein